MSLSSTPSANRVHIGLYGKRNSGKSSLINAITNQETALVSDSPAPPRILFIRPWRLTASAPAC